MTDETIFAAALEKASAAERAGFVVGACDGPDQRARVESLLAAHDRAGGFLDRPAVAADSDDLTNTTAPDEAVTRTTDPTAGDPDDADAVPFLAPPGRPDSLGRLGHYEVLEVLGRGGFGVVYRAFDDKLQRVVAVKILAPHLAVTSPARKRFLREARSAAVVQHEHVVRIHETGETPLPYLVMEFVPGETLQQRMDRTGPLEVAEAIGFARQIASGLAAAHDKGLIHRDIKPSNILIDAGGQQAKITDFGLARAADDASLTRSGTVAGTPMYMAPEQARGEQLDQRADLFSLGSVLYTLLTGRPPFRAPNTPAVLKRVAEDDPRPIREVIPEVPEWVCRIIAKLHAKNPADRFQTAAEVADLLADCERQLAERNGLTDYSRIPGGMPAKPQRWSRRRVQLAGGLLGFAALLYLALWAGPFAYRYATGRGTLEILPADGLVSVIVLQNDEGDLVTDKLHTPVTDWLGMKEKSQSLTLPPGQYQLNVGTYPYGTDVGQWEVTTADLFGRRTTTVPVTHTSAIIPVGRGERVTVRPKMVTGTRPPAPASPAADGFTPLFNGKDLTGWTPHPDNQATWAVENGALTAKGDAGYLATTRADYRDFHLRAEVKVNNQGNSGIVFRHNPGGSLTQQGALHYEADILGGSLGHLYTRRGGRELNKLASKEIIWAQSWVVYEVIASGGRITVKMDGRVTIDTTEADPILTPGHIILESATANTAVQFRRIEIRELPASSPAVPKSAADVLPFLAGSWKAEMEKIAPQPPSNETSSVGVVTFDRVAGGTLLRQRGGPANEFGQPHFLYSFDAGRGLRRWVAWSAGATAGPVAGTFNADSRTLLWMHHIATDGPYNVEMHFADSDTVRVRAFRLDPENKISRESRLVFTRLKRPTAPTPDVPADPTRPAEVKVLDRMAGEWRSEQTVTDAARPDRPNRQATRTTAGSILGGRFVEKFVTNEMTGTSDYAVLWYDAAAKAYRRWNFADNGQFLELVGTWDDTAKALTLTAADDSLAVREVFRGDDRSEFHITFKSKDGRTVKETVGVARRVSPSAKPAVSVQPLRDKVAAAQAARDLTKTKFDAGTVSGVEMARADGDLADAKAELAAAECDKAAAAAAVTELRKQRQREREMIGLRAKEGLEKPEVVLDADARLRAAWGRAAQLGLEPERPTAPYEEKKAKAHQEAWAKHLGVPVAVSNGIGMTFRLIPPGRFVMGSPENEPGRNAEREGPPHPVTIDAPFYLGVYEVTQEQYQAVAGADPKRTGKDNPAGGVSYEDAVEFCRRLSEAADEKTAGRVYRLPTESEWEYACRAGTTTAYSFGDDPAKLDEHAWTKATATGPRSVGRLKPNPWGLYDMHGNVFETCGDRRDYATGRSESGSPVIARGGSWHKPAADARSAYRGQNLAKGRYADVGFRVVLEVGKK